jgi:hypothetical protein
MRGSLNRSTGIGSRSCGVLGPGTQNFAPDALKRMGVSGDHSKASRQGDGGDQRVAQGQRTARLCGNLAPGRSSTCVEIQDAILARQFGDESLDVAVIGMVRLQGVKALPRFGQTDRRNEQPGCILAGVPLDYPLIRARLSDFTDEIRVENEAHRDTRRTRSSGMRGISQSVVPRMRSYHDISCWLVRALVRLRRRARTLPAEGFGNCSSHAKSFLACFGDKRLTSLMANSTALTSKICARPQMGARIESSTSSLSATCCKSMN